MNDTASIVISLADIEVEAVLNLHGCPKICRAFLLALPHSDRAIHESMSGDAIGTLNPFPIPPDVWEPILHPFPGIEDRSFKTILNPGDVVYYPGGGISKLVVSYGEALFSVGPAGPAYVNHVATIREEDPQFDAFLRKAAETRDGGSKTILFRRR